MHPSILTPLLYSCLMTNVWAHTMHVQERQEVFFIASDDFLGPILPSAHLH